MKQELEEGVLDGWWGPQAPKADGRLTSCVALGKYPGLPVPWFPHPYEAMVRAPTPGTAVGLNEINV